MSLKGYGWPLILSCFPLALFGVEKVTILELSSTQKSIMIDRGAEIDHVRIGQRAKFYIQKSADFPHMIYVGEGEAIKVHNNYSYWYLKSLEQPKLLKKGAQLDIISDDEVLEGRRDLVVKDRRIVLPEGENADEYEQNNKNGLPQKLIRKQDGYIENDQQIVDEFPHSEDIRENRYGEWDEESSLTNDNLSGEVKSKRSSLLSKEKTKGDSVKDYRREVFESSTDGSIGKINASANPLEALYGEKRFAEKEGSLVQTSMTNVFKTIQEDQKKSKVIPSSDWAKVKTDDPRWSEEMTDKQLRRFFVESNIEREINRQRFALNNAPNNEFLFRYVMGMSQKANTADASNQGTAQAIDTSYEFHLLRTTDALRDWTVEGGFTWGYNFYDTDVYNARATEQTVHGAINYYFYNGPSTLNSYLWHVGLGMRFGMATLSSEKFDEDYGYQLSSTYAQLGVKYRFSGGDYDLDMFRVGLGLNALLLMERTTLSSNQPISQYDVNGNIVTNDMKFSVGMSVFF